jgi:GT2 family glycosyltransferase
MSHVPRVDVTILSLNRTHDTIEAIASAAEQEGVETHLWVVDQGSDPQHLARLQEFIQTVPRAKLKALARNVGVPAGRNLAAAMGDAPHIVALDNDAVLADRSTLARAAAHLESNPDLCAIGFRIMNYFTGDHDWTSWDYPAPHQPDDQFSTTRFIGAGHAIRRSSFEATGGYDERLFFAGEEWDLSYRMLNTGQRIEYVPSICVRHKVSPEHRLVWHNGRFFYIARNTVYSCYKFGAPPPRMLLCCAALLLRGLRNSVALEAARGIVASIALCRAFQQSNEDKDQYQLSAETWAYIYECEPSRRETVIQKVRRQFELLQRYG